jgi:hypothetical protein
MLGQQAGDRVDHARSQATREGGKRLNTARRQSRAAQRDDQSCAGARLASRCVQSFSSFTRRLRASMIYSVAGLLAQHS